MPRDLAPLTPITQADTDDQLVAMWLHGRPARTQAHYTSMVREFRATAAVPIQRIGLGHIQTYAASLEHLAPRTQANRLSAIKSLFTFALKIGYIPLNPAVAVQMPRIKNALAERILSEGDVLRMIYMEPDNRNRSVLWLLYVAGLRRAELAGIRARDLSPRGEETGQITVFGKGGKTRAILVDKATWADIKPVLTGDPDAPLYVSQKGTPLSSSQVYRIVERRQTSGSP